MSSITRYYKTAEKCFNFRAARTASFSVAVVLVVAVLMGEWILLLFGITVASFKVGGGILIFLTAISMIHLQQLREKQTPEEARDLSRELNPP